MSRWLRGRGGWLVAGAGAVAAAIGVYVLTRNRNGDDDASGDDDVRLAPTPRARSEAAPPTPAPAADVGDAAVAPMPRVEEDRRIVPHVEGDADAAVVVHRPGPDPTAIMRVVAPTVAAILALAVVAYVLALFLGSETPSASMVTVPVTWSLIGALGVEAMRSMDVSNSPDDIAITTGSAARPAPPTKKFVDFQPTSAGAPAAPQATPAAASGSSAAAADADAAAGAAAGAGTSGNDVFANVDNLLDDDRVADAKEALQPLLSDGQPEEVQAAALWRMARILNIQGTQLSAKGNKDAARKVFVQAHDNALRSVDLYPTSGGHKWMAILIAKVANGTKEKIKNAFKIQEHAIQAAELDPTDPVPRHVLGEWAYNVAGIGWLERKAAAALFASPPEATYADALKAFLAAEDLKPGFFLTNRVRIVQCLLAMNRKAEARRWMAKVDEMEPTVHDGASMPATIAKLRKSL